MNPTGVERRLTAILAADVVGFNRLIAADKTETLKKLKSLSTELIEPRRAAFYGRVVRFSGDGILMEFASVIGAVQFAMQLQKSVQGWTAANFPDQPFALRIGINLDDVIVQNGDILGSGVEVAAGLVAFAEPGSVCISERVYEQIRDKLKFEFNDMGPQDVAGIDQPVRVFEVLTDQQTGNIRQVRRTTTWPLKPISLALASFVVLLSVAGAILWRQSLDPGQDNVTPQSAPTPIEHRPSIVVLPFENLSDDVKQEYFADGMTVDLTTDLAKMPGLFVISRNSAFTYKGKKPEIQDVAKALQVEYVLHGSIRRADDLVRINVRLVDTETERNLWAEKFDGNLNDIFVLQDKVISKVVDTLALKLAAEGSPPTLGTGTDIAVAHDAYLRGLALYYRRKPVENAKAAEHFRRAIGFDPGYAAAYTALAKVYVQAAIGEHAYAEELGIHWVQGYTEARRLLEHGKARPNADFHVLKSWLALRKRQYHEAIVESRKALALNPNDADALEALSEALIYGGQPNEGMAYANQALRQNPTLRGRPLYLLGVAAFALDEMDKAVEQIERAMLEQPERKADFAGILAAAYGTLGRASESRSAFATFSKGIQNRPSMAWTAKSQNFTNPRYHTWRRVDLAWAVFSHPFATGSVLIRLAQGLRIAGAAESVGGFLMLDHASRLNGDEIAKLLFGRTISGANFWISEIVWQQQRSDDGSVQHSGDAIHPGLPQSTEARGRIENDLLCETWPALAKELELCVVIFKVSESNARLRWGDYVMVTDIGPQPFRVRP